MMILLFLYPVLVLALGAVAIYEHVSSSYLSLLLSAALTIITILLPIISAANVFHLYRWVRIDKSKPTTSRWASRMSPAHPAVFQALQGLLTAVLATLFAQGFVRDRIFGCAMETTWQSLWTSHDGDAIRRIQDAFDCCGFNSARDRAWPFPHGGGSVSCMAQYGRTMPCNEPWSRAMQRNSGVDFAVVVIVGLLQITTLLLSRSFRSWHRQGGTSWFGAFNFTGGTRMDNPERTRPLIAGGEAYTDDDDEEGRGPSRGPSGENGNRRGTNNHGSTGPRIEPSSLHEDETANRNAWEDP